VELLDKTLDGSQSKLSMKIPADLAGRLLGQNAEQIQVPPPVTSVPTASRRQIQDRGALLLGSTSMAPIQAKGG